MKTKRTFILPVIAGMLSLISFLGLFACGKPNNPDAPDKPGVGHSHSFTRQDSGSEYLASEATCTEKARYYFSCECGEKGTKTFEYGETNKKNHDYKDTIVPPTNTSDGYTRHTCTRCGDTYDDNVIYAAGSSGLVFTDLDDGCMVTGVGSCTDTEIYIPTVSPEGKKVYAIGERAFMDCNTVTAIHIPKYVAVVCSQAFHNANNLTTVYIHSDSLNGEDEISAFISPSIKKVVFDGKSVGYYVLFNCNNITEVIINDSVTSIGLKAFEGCTSLKYNVKDNVKYLGNENNPYLAVMGVTDKTLTAYQIENTARFIYDSAFEGCALLKSIVVPDGVTDIGGFAFYNCSSLTSVTIPESVTKIANEAFYDGYLLKNVYYNGDLNSWLQLDGVQNLMNEYINTAKDLTKNLYIKGKLLTEAEITNVTELNAWAFVNCKSLTKVVIGNSVTKIGDGAFYGCSGLKSITIPDSVTKIGHGAFEGCKLLSSITIPNSVTSIGISTFSDCTRFTSIIIPDSVTSIGEYAFNNCRGLTSVTIGKGVTSIDKNAFYDCYKLVEVVNNSSLNITKGSSDYGKVAERALNVKQGGNSDIVNQNGYLFYTYDGSDYLMGYAGSDTDLILPENYNGKNYEIYEKAFYICRELTSITIPDSVTSIGWSAFYNCRGLTSVTIGNCVTSIGGSAFEDCSGLKEIHYKGTIKEWNGVKKGNSWDYNTGKYTVFCTDGNISK